ncbi:DUF3563 domain-containing protein [Paraburkholderia sp. UCT31]|uniref:DUF3563 family protein n=1 Tax=Paraburkholderia sp. UCT31 TaxID=2615209 RepID=UPI00165553FC|nr:DUF3563 family protein [Paraburkholderia sp. UCT31]MBC8739769.1 DUF3563 domain-containing protein [Paraburkholderia sp. UCT31]
MKTLVSKLIALLKFNPEQSAHARRDAYLAEATDLYDLEARMRHLERQSLYPRGFGGHAW